MPAGTAEFGDLVGLDVGALGRFFRPVLADGLYTLEVDELPNGLTIDFDVAEDADHLLTLLGVPPTRT